MLTTKPCAHLTAIAGQNQVGCGLCDGKADLSTALSPKFKHSRSGQIGGTLRTAQASNGPDNFVNAGMSRNFRNAVAKTVLEGATEKMAAIPFDPLCAELTCLINAEESSANATAPKPRLHRIRTVRRLQDVSLRTAARHLGTSVRHVRIQESEFSDLKLSELYQWQALLDVPVEELLVEPTSPLSRCVTERARLVRVMKTATAILEAASTPQMVCLAERLVEQLIELMPELREVGPWHAVGRRRSSDELGRIAEQCFPDDSLSESLMDSGD
jgi:transcriptional regulator with XRE-family HTH domain